MIDPRAIIDPTATIAEGVEIGPWTIVGPEVELGEGTVVASHVVLKGPTKIGKNNRIFQFSSIGEDTPDLKFKGERTELIVGDNNVFREGVTVHRGTEFGGGRTTIGSNNLIMAYAHIGHDSHVGNNTIIVNNTALAGHVIVGDWAILSGFSMIHQFCKVGAHAFTGMGAAIGKDVPAYVTATDAPASAKTVNVEGLKRRGFSKEAIAAIRRGYKILYRQGLLVEEALERLDELATEHPEVKLMADSVRASERGIIR